MPRLKKDCFRATPKPAREPRALPGCTRILYLSFGAERSRGISRATPVSTVHPRMMKQVLLRVPTVFAEICLGELAQPLRGHFISTRKITLPQHTLYPYIDRECSQPLIRKKHHAICNLRPHAWQCAQVFSEVSIRQHRPRFEIRFAGADEPRRLAQVFGAIAEFAFE